MGHETYRFTVKTPLHVGTGEKLGKTDIAPQRSQWIVVDMESVFSLLQDNLSAFDALDDSNFDLSRFLKQNKISPGKVKKYSLVNPDNIRFDFRKTEVLEMIKTGMGKPIIPGSSVKGAIRTVIWWHLMQLEENRSLLEEKLREILNNPRISKERADDKLDKELFGKNPNYDVMRGLQVGDVEFELSDMRLVESKVLSLARKGFGWKRFTTCSESLNPGAVSFGKMKLDEFLFDSPLARTLKFYEKKALFASLPEECNEFARNFIEEEIDFFKSCGMEEMVKFYTVFLKEIPESNTAFLIHLGWGSGWKSMTGNYLTENALKKLRERFGLGKLICPQCGKDAKKDTRQEGKEFCFGCKKSFPIKLFPEFPKTRKIAFQNGKPAFPLGWIRVERVSQAELNASAPKPSPPKPRLSELMQNFEAFRLRPDPQKFVVFAQGITPGDMDELKAISVQGVSIGYVGPFLACDIPDEIRKVLAGKLLEVIKKNKKWSADKLEKYEKLRCMV